MEEADEVLRAATERHIARLAEAGAPAALDTWDAWEDWLGRIVRLHERQSRDEVCEVAALAGRALDGDRAVRESVGRMCEQWTAVLRDRLVAMQRNDVLRADVPAAELASTVLAALQGGAVIDKATGSGEHLANALRQVLVLLRAYALPV